MNQQQIDSTTQEYLDVFDITNDMVIMKDGTASVIINVDAVNFGLLAEEEQDAIMYAYAGLLNSLNFSIQIVIKSQTKDITAYLKKLLDKEEEIVNPVKKRQIAEYREFVSQLIQERNVLDKKFYVVIPASPIELGLISTQSVLPGIKTAAVASFDKTLILDRAMTNLYPKRDHLIGQFSRIGLYARQLNTQEIIQLFYMSYNPEASEGVQLSDSSSYSVPLVSATTQAAPV